MIALKNNCWDGVTVKKIVLLMLLIVALLLCCSCEYSYVQANDTIWAKDRVRLDLDEVELNRSHPYDIIYTENGRDIVFHFLNKIEE